MKPRRRARLPPALAIAQRVIHSLNGEITATSAPGEESTFTVRLPV